MSSAGTDLKTAIATVVRGKKGRWVKGPGYDADMNLVEKFWVTPSGACWKHRDHGALGRGFGSGTVTFTGPLATSQGIGDWAKYEVVPEGRWCDCWWDTAIRMWAQGCAVRYGGLEVKGQSVFSIDREELNGNWQYFQED